MPDAHVVGLRQLRCEATESAVPQAGDRGRGVGKPKSLGEDRRVEVVRVEVGETVALLEPAGNSLPDGLPPVFQPVAVEEALYHQEAGVWHLAWFVAGEGSLPQVAEPAVVACAPDDIASRLEGLLQAADADAPADVPAAWAVLLREAISSAFGASAPRARLGDMWRAVQADLGRAWDLASLAREASLGTEQLRTLCHRDAFAFSTAYRRWAGTSPSSYRGQGPRPLHSPRGL